MAFTMTELAATIWRDYNTVGVPASGKYSPEKSEIRQWGLEIEQYLNGTSTLDQVKIGGGSINSTPIGPTSRSTGAFTTLAANAAASLLGGGTLTGTFAGNPILSGNPAFSGQPDFSGATNKAAIRTAIGLGSIATQAANSVALTGGAIDGVALGGTTPAAVVATTVTATGNVTGANLSGTNTGDEVAATDSVAGVVEKATTAEMAAGTADKFPDAAEVAAYENAQTLTDVFGSRAAATQYTNSTGRPITVMVTGRGDTGATTRQVELEGLVDGSTVIRSSYIDRSSADGHASITFIVPNGSTYQVNLSGVNTPTLRYWWELR